MTLIRTVADYTKKDYRRMIDGACESGKPIVFKHGIPFDCEDMAQKHKERLTDYGVRELLTSPFQKILRHAKDDEYFSVKFPDPKMDNMVFETAIEVYVQRSQNEPTN